MVGWFHCSRTLNASKQHHSALEEQIYTIVEAVMKWRRYLLSNRFMIATEQPPRKTIGFHNRGRVRELSAV